jgi:MFS family permease
MGRRPFFYGWVVVGVAALITCMGMGALFSLGVFLKPIAEATGWSRTGISTVALLNWLFMGVGSFVWGALSDRYGTRPVAVAGGALLGLGLVASSQVRALWQLHLTFGALVGLAVGAFYAPLTATATRWFTARRGLAVALVSAGIGFGVLVTAPLARWLVELGGWRIAMLALGDLAWLVIIPAALFLREHPSDVGQSALGSPRPGQPASPAPAFSARQVARSGQFWAIGLTHFACCAAHSGPIFHMVTHAMDQGVAAMAAATVLSTSGLASVAGRIATGLLADRWGAKRVLVAGLTLQATVIFLYLGAREVVTFYALALVFGAAYGGVMPLYALLTREYFGERVMGTAYGGVFLISTLGMGLGSVAGGWVFDVFGSYAGMFLGAGAMGGVAALLATTFRPPRPAPAP